MDLFGTKLDAILRRKVAIAKVKAEVELAELSAAEAEIRAKKSLINSRLTVAISKAKLEAISQPEE